MFLSKNQIHEKIEEIILDDNDNDVIFVVATKGIGKTRLLRQICTIHSDDAQLIVTCGDGEEGKVSSIRNAFIDAIIKYFVNHNTFKVRGKLYKSLAQFNSKISLLDRPFGKRIQRRFKEKLETILSTFKIKDLKKYM